MEIYHAQPRLLEAIAHDWRDEWAHQDELAGKRVKRVALTTWETDTLPDAYAIALAKYDHVIVPSDFCADVIGEHHLLKLFPHVVPHCFDEDFWPKMPPQVRPADLPYRFYTIGAWGERKNPIGILRAYLHAFSKSDNVELMMCINDADFDECRSVIARSGIPSEQLPVVHIPDMTNNIQLSEEQLVELHLTADCFVSATRCEGFGLGMFEAAISGRHIIAPVFGGQADFLEHYGGFCPIRASLTPCIGVEKKELIVHENGSGPVQVSRVTMPPGVTGKHMWAEPDLHDLSERMKAISLAVDPNVDIYGQLIDWGKERLELEQRFGYKVVGPQLAHLLKELV